MGLATLAMAVLMGIREVMSDNVITGSEVVVVVIAGFNVLTVWGAANIPGFQRAKTLMAAIGVTLNVLVALIVGGLTTDEIMLLIIHFLGALGVVAGPQPQHRAVSATAGTAPPTRQF